MKRKDDGAAMFIPFGTECLVASESRVLIRPRFDWHVAQKREMERRLQLALLTL